MLETICEVLKDAYERLEHICKIVLASGKH